MVTTTDETKEAERIRLARCARGMVKLDAEYARLQGEEKDRRKAEKERHKSALKKVKNFQEKVVDPVGAKVQRAHAAMSELRAQHLERALITAEGRTRAAVNKLARSVRDQRGALDRAKADYKKYRSKGDTKGTQFEKDIDAAGLEVAKEVDKLEAANAEWDKARAALDAAIAEVLRVPGEEEPEEPE